jgi:fluoride exporter
MFKQLLIVAVGGALGSVARYKLGALVLHTGSWNFPWSTFCINALGCFLIGLLAALVEHHDLFPPSVRLALFTGALGGFTTFSAFGYESVFLFRHALPEVAVEYILASVVGGLVAVFAGIKLVDAFWSPHH